MDYEKCSHEDPEVVKVVIEVGGKTIVDYEKCSHEDPEVVKVVIELMNKHFGDLAITRWDKHSFLGMNITITEKGE